MRIVSLIPSGTEIIALLGAQDMLVGRSHECDFPASIESVCSLTAQNTHFDPQSGMGASEINRAVNESVDASKSLYQIDTQKLRELEPDLIITQDLCSVCSIDLDSVREVAQSLSKPAQILSLNPKTIEDILDDIYRVGQAIGFSDQAMHQVVALRQRMDRAEEHVNPYDDGPVCGFMEWTDPIYVAGHWNVQLIERAGARHPLNEAVAKPGSGAAVGPQQAERIAGHSIAVPENLFCATNPEHLVIAPCGLTLEQSIIETNRIYQETDWFSTIPAVQQNRVAIVDGNQMFNRPGPRVVDALEFMVGWLNRREHLIPTDFPWQAWSAPNSQHS
ncbi:MAG: ABC transporter substrate-binding protein [Phycisphaerales bacterium]|nr:ABC transporter substrate-binding protein [Phycisphaerales bacterium]